MIGKIHSFESFGSADGPGIRFLVFMQGCGFRCKYCHNPDTWARAPQIEATPEEVLKKALRYRNYWDDLGGITVSGGEPLLQIEFVTELFKLAKAEGVNTCIDTAGGPFSREAGVIEKFEALAAVTDVFMLDIKHIDDDAHRELTGASNKSVLDFARWLAEKGKRVWIRHVLVPGINDSDDALNRTGEFIRSLGNVERVDVLPYHTLGTFKWKELGIPYGLEGVDPPSDESIAKAKAALTL